MIRKAAGIEFPGLDPTRSNLIAEVEVTERHRGASVTTPSASMACTGWRTDGRCRVIVTERSSGRAASPPCAI